MNSNGSNFLAGLCVTVLLLAASLSPVSGGGIIETCPEGFGFNEQVPGLCLECLPGSTSNGTHCLNECEAGGLFIQTNLYIDAALKKHCYGYSSTSMIWTSARDACISNFGGHLATFTDDQEYQHVDDEFASQPRYWVGGHDRSVEGQYVWVTGEYFGDVTWRPMQPDNFQGNEDCLEHGNLEAGLNDYPCGSSLPFMCEVNQAVLNLCTALPAGDTGSGKWQDGAGGWHCYWDLATDGSKSDVEQNQRCVDAGPAQSHLASLTEAGEHAQVKDILNNEQFVFDANDLEQSDRYKPSFTNELQSYYDWGGGQPNDGNEHCVQSTSTGWHDYPCTHESHPVCEYEEFAWPACAGYIRADPMDKQYHCYTYVASNADFATAGGFCQSSGGNLVSLRSYAEFVGANSITPSGTIYSIGFDNRGRSEPNDFVWTSGEDVNYTKWGANQPDDFQGDEDCGEANSSAMNWNDAPCSIAKTYICETIL